MKVKKGTLDRENVAISAEFFLLSVENIAHLLEKLITKIRELYFRAVLFAKSCPKCGLPELVMLRDSWCKCRSCGQEFDPTTEFQPCPKCGAALNRQIYHYWCEQCRRPVISIYCFDAKVFDEAYFREMMRESRERKREKREQIKLMLAQSRSGPLILEKEPYLTAVPDLEQALNAFVNIPISLTVFLNNQGKPRFEMNLYRQHILELASGCVVHFEGVSRLIDDVRLDRIFRFITIIFMQHHGEIEITQDYTGEIILRGK